MGSGAFQDDPGWPVGTGLLRTLLPFGHLADARSSRGAGQPAIVAMRTILLSVWAALALLVLVTFLALPAGGEATNEPVAWGLLVVGGVAALAGGAFARRRPLRCAEPGSLVAQYRTTFFIGIALVDLAALLGFVAAFISSTPWPYLVGLAPTAIGYAMFAPTRSRLAAVDRDLQASGCAHSLRAGLYGDGGGTPDTAA